ncbi:MAG: type II secretion system protein [Bacilli bacterium]|nr:type II secretion system protein [Bacilli bacterium]
MKKDGFTLVELLGVMVILAIVISLVSISYARLDDSVTKTYYDSLKESILMSASDYFYYNDSVKKVTIKELVDKKYIEKVTNQNGEVCDLENSYILSYLNELKETKYEICLKCGLEYDSTTSDVCKNN